MKPIAKDLATKSRWYYGVSLKLMYESKLWAGWECYNEDDRYMYFRKPRTR